TRFSRDWSSDVCSSDLAGGDAHGVVEGEDGDSILDPDVFDRIPERVVVVSPNYRIFYSNQTNAARSGLARESLVGRHFADLIGIHHFQRDMRLPLDRCLAGESASVTYAQQRDEQTVVISCRMSPCYSNPDSLAGALVIMQEMADRRRSRPSHNRHPAIEAASLPRENS